MEVRSASPAEPGGPEELDRWGPGWARAMTEGLAAGRHAAAGPPPEELLAALRRTTPDRTATALAAVVSGRVVGAARVSLPLLDDTTTADVDLAVPPEQRGRGVGTSLLGSVARLALARGRSRLVVRVARPLRPGAAPEEADPAWPGSRFAAAAGMRRAAVDVRPGGGLAPAEVVEEWRGTTTRALAHVRHGRR